MERPAKAKQKSACFHTTPVNSYLANMLFKRFFLKLFQIKFHILLQQNAIPMTIMQMHDNA